MKKLCWFLTVALLCASFAAPAAVIKTVQAGATDQTVVIKIIDATDGTPETSVAFNSAGIDLEFWRHGANSVVDITEVTQSVSGAHTDGGFIHLGNGYYRLDLPDAAVASGAAAVEVLGSVTGMVVIGGTVQLSPPVNVVTFGGTAVTGRDIGQSVLLSSGTGTGQLALSSGAVSANIASGGITETSFATTTGSFAPLGLTRQGPAQGATSTTVTLDASAPFADNTNIGSTLWVRGSTNGNYWQSCSITAYVASSRIATVSCPSGFVTPTGTISYQVFGVPPGSGGAGLDAAGVRSALGLSSPNIDTQLTGLQSDTDNIQTRIPNALVSGRMDVTVGAYQSGLTPLQPTVPGRALDVSAGGEAGIDLANVGSPTASLNLSGTTVASVSGAVGSVGTNGINAASLAPDAGAELADTFWDEDATGHQTQGSFGQAIGDPASDADSIWSLANLNLNATVGSRATQTSVDSVSSAIASLPNSIRDLIIEDQGGGVSLGCALSIALAYAAGDLTTTGSSPTYRDASGTETRVSGTISSTGNRNMTITCPTY